MRAVFADVRRAAVKFAGLLSRDLSALVAVHFLLWSSFSCLLVYLHFSQTYRYRFLLLGPVIWSEALKAALLLAAVVVSQPPPGGSSSNGDQTLESVRSWKWLPLTGLLAACFWGSTMLTLLDLETRDTRSVGTLSFGVQALCTLALMRMSFPGHRLAAFDVLVVAGLAVVMIFLEFSQQHSLDALAVLRGILMATYWVSLDRFGKQVRQHQPLLFWILNACVSAVSAAMLLSVGAFYAGIDAVIAVDGVDLELMLAVCLAALGSVASMVIVLSAGAVSKLVISAPHVMLFSVLPTALHADSHLRRLAILATLAVTALSITFLKRKQPSSTGSPQLR